jgi:hypothetical protein
MQALAAYVQHLEQTLIVEDFGEIEYFRDYHYKMHRS